MRAQVLLRTGLVWRPQHTSLVCRYNRHRVLVVCSRTFGSTTPPPAPPDGGKNPDVSGAGTGAVEKKKGPLGQRIWKRVKEVSLFIVSTLSCGGASARAAPVYCALPENAGGFQAPTVGLVVDQTNSQEAHHYWTGTKMLGRNVKVSSKLLRRVAKGEILSRREKILLEVTVADMIRMVPFIVIAIVPFLEFSLPILLKFFPNMLPSTYMSKAQLSVSLLRVSRDLLVLIRFRVGQSGRSVEDQAGDGQVLAGTAQFCPIGLLTPQTSPPRPA
jgi:hypothetical protein